MSENESWRQVVDANPAAMKPSDVANLGPPPRDLTPAHETYIKVMKRSYAGVLGAFAALSIGSFSIMVAIVGFEVTMLRHLWLPFLLIGLTVWQANTAKHTRAVLRKALREGTLRMAFLESNIQTVHGRGMGKRYKCTARFNVDGTKVTLVSFHPSMSLLEPGTWFEVVWSAETPTEIVPTFLLA